MIKKLLLFVIIMCFFLVNYLFSLTPEQQAILDSYSQIEQSIILEYKQHEQRIISIWGEFKDSGETTQVVYSNDFKSRSFIDYETGVINIQLIHETVPTTEELLKEFQNLVKSVQNLTDADGRKIFDTFEEEIYEKSIQKVEKETKYYNYRIILPQKHLYNRYLQYKDIITRNSKRFNIPEYLIISIIKNESAFNPYAKSHVAYGLMQIVPNTGGRAAHNHIFGYSITPTVQSLYRPEQNILYGTAYIHKLKHKYFNHLKHLPEIQKMCIIAAYNAGPGRVSRIIRNLDFNSISNDEFYNYLFPRLPNETKNYLQKNLTDIKMIKSDFLS